MYLESLKINSKIKNYEVFFENNNEFLKELSIQNNSIFVVDKNVYELYKTSDLSFLPNDKLIELEINEDNKNINTVCYLYEKIMEFAPRKNLNLVSIGGGITQDITGFVASSLYRGVNWIYIPTTLLAQVDSCIGAKTSLNFKNYKNLVGTFYPPSKVHIFPEFLKTLTKEDFYSGVGEMAKLHIMNGEADAETFVKELSQIDSLDSKVLLERTLNCLRIKKDYIENDEFDTGRRNLLNYGHCFGHAIESSTNFMISHGQAVVVGMIIANMEALARGILDTKTEKFVREQILLPSLKVKVPRIDIDMTVKAMGQDKKNLGNGLALVMLKDGYNLEKITDLSDNRAKVLLEEFSKLVVEWQK